MCEPCREDRRPAKRARHAERRAAGLCVKRAAAAPGGKSYCGPCAAVRNARRQRNPEAKREADCDAARDRYDARWAAGVSSAAPTTCSPGSSPAHGSSTSTSPSRRTGPGAW